MKLTSFEHHQAGEIIELFEQTFSDSEGPEEGRIIGGLVEDMLKTPDEDLHGFTANEGDNITACIFFSRMDFESDMTAFILSPVATLPGHQGKGIGQKLIRHGLDVLKKNSIDLVLTYGDPAFYGKVGFASVSTETLPAPFPLSQPEGWLAQSLTGSDIRPIQGRSFCVKALSQAAYW